MSYKALLLSAASAAALLCAGPAFATPSLPSGGSFSSGSGSFSTSGSTETVTLKSANSSYAPGSSTPEAVINWSGGYDVASGDTLKYALGSTATGGGAVVNVDNSGAASAINGTIDSPDLAQVIVNANGVSVGKGAVLPGAFGAVAGSYSSGTLTANGKSVTIAPGATFASTSVTRGIVSIGVTEPSSGDTLPDTKGLTADVSAPSGASFALQPGQTGKYVFSGGGTLTITGSGVTARSLNISSTGPVDASKITSSGRVQIYPDSGSSPGSGTSGNVSKVGNISATKGVMVSAGDGSEIDVNGPVSSSEGNVGVQSVSQGLSNYSVAYSPPNSTATGVVKLAPNVTLSAGTEVMLEGDNIDFTGSETLNAPSYDIETNHAIDPAASTGATITDSSKPSSGTVSKIRAPSISNLTVGSAGAVELSANSVSNASISAPSVTMKPAGYEKDPSYTDYKPLSVSNTTLKTPALDIQGAYGVSLDSVTQTAKSPRGVTIVGDTGGYPADTSASANDVTIKNSSLVGSTVLVEAGKNSSSSNPLPGDVTIAGSTITAYGGMSGGVSSAPAVSVNVADGGSISVGSASTLSANGGGACNGVSCSTSVEAKSIDFKSGNKETASGTNGYTGTISGSPSATPTETKSTNSSYGNVVLTTGTSTSGTITVAGTLDAGTPSSTTSGGSGVSTGNGSGTSTGTGSGVSTGDGSGGRTGGGTSTGNGAGSAGPGSPIHTGSGARTSAVAAASQAALAARPVQVRPSAGVSQVQQRGMTVLVPEKPSPRKRPQKRRGHRAE